MSRCALLAPALIGLGSVLASAGAMAGQNVDYQVDGEAFQGYFAPATSSSKGSVLIIHDWDGLTDYERKRADMLAEAGYAAFAVDLYGAGNRPEEIDARFRVFVDEKIEGLQIEPRWTAKTLARLRLETPAVAPEGGAARTAWQHSMSQSMCDGRPGSGCFVSGFQK